MQHDADYVDENGMVGEGVKFHKIRRITGYLVGSIERFNGAKRAEVNDRVKHFQMQTPGMKPTSQQFAAKAVEKSEGTSQAAAVNE